MKKRKYLEANENMHICTYSTGVFFLYILTSIVCIKAKKEREKARKRHTHTHICIHDIMHVMLILQIRMYKYRLKYDESKYNNKTEVENASQMKNGQCKRFTILYSEWSSLYTTFVPSQ